MKRSAAVVFVTAVLGWVWLEVFSDQPVEGLKGILFWIGMGAVLVSGWGDQSRASR